MCWAQTPRLISTRAAASKQKRHEKAPGAKQSGAPVEWGCVRNHATPEPWLNSWKYFMFIACLKKLAAQREPDDRKSIVLLRRDEFLATALPLSLSVLQAAD